MYSRFLKHSLVIRASLDGMELRIILLLCYILAKQPVLLILPEHLSYCINIDILEMHCIIKTHFLKQYRDLWEDKQKTGTPEDGRYRFYGNEGPQEGYRSLLCIVSRNRHSLFNMGF